MESPDQESKKNVVAKESRIASARGGPWNHESEFYFSYKV